MITAKVKYTDALQFVGESASGHAVVMDASREYGGTETGMSPMQMLLVALGGCTGMDVVSVLKKKREPFTGLEINIKGERADGHPQYFKKLTIEYVIKGKGVSEDAVKRSIDLSFDKYCSVKASLEDKAEISYTYRIVDE